MRSLLSMRAGAQPRATLTLLCTERRGTKDAPVEEDHIHDVDDAVAGDLALFPEHRQIVKSSATLFRKEFKRRKIAKALSGTIVDNGDDPSDLLIRDVMEVTAFREEEAEHVIRALI